MPPIDPLAYALIGFAIAIATIGLLASFSGPT